MNRRIHCAPISPAAVPQRAKQACWSMKLRRTGIWHRSPTGWRPGARPDCWPAARALHPCCRGCCSCPAGTPRRCRSAAVCSRSAAASTRSRWSSARRPRRRERPASASRRSRSSRGTGRPARRRAKCWELCYGPVRRSRWWCWTQAARWRTRARTKPQTASRSPIRWARCSSVCWTTGWRARC